MVLISVDNCEVATGEQHQTERPASKAPSTRGSVANVGWAVYQQIAAVLGAFALAALLGHFIDIGWQGLLDTLVGYWDEHVRPTVHWALRLLISRPLMWAFSWDVEIPLIVRDYLSVGVITALSIFREVRRFFRTGYLRLVLLPERGKYSRLPLTIMGWLPIIPLIWPLSLAFWIAALVQAIHGRSKTWFHGVLVVSPLLYLGLLLAINSFVLQ